MNSIRYIRIAILCLFDVVFLVVAALLSFIIVDASLSNFRLNYLLVVVFQISILFVCKVYNLRLLDSSLELAIRAFCLFLTSFIGVIVLCLLGVLTSQQVRLISTYTVFSYFFIVGYRAVDRYLMYHRNRRIHGYSNKLANAKNRAIVYGAGETGKALLSQAEKGNVPYNIIGFLDDNKAKQNTLIYNRSVLGTINDVTEVLVAKEATILIIAIAQLSAQNMQKAVTAANKVGVAVKIVPSLFEMDSQNKKALDLRTVNYSDLLGRELIKIDKQPIKQMIEDKVVLITGACGSIGSEIARQAKSYKPKQLLLLDIDESGLHDTALRLLQYKAEWSNAVMPILCDIKNEQKIDSIIATYKPDIIFHAAAYKHVPMLQLYPEEGIRTNVAGSFNVLNSAKKHEVKKVVVISTDKAVNPTNVMGATKRMVELEASLLSCSKTQMVSVRFGNVIGSRGSMLPLFLEEIQAGVPITVTDKNIIRYFMAIPEAVSLVFLAGSLGKGGEVMVLDMGKPINIYKFAQRLISMYGDPLKNKIKITGLRPGEKMYEELLANKDNTIATDNTLIFKAKVANNTLKKEVLLERLSKINTTDVDTLKTWLRECVPELCEK